MQNNKQGKLPIIAVCGPTASGKSDLSIALGKSLGAEILSFDASQVFQEADIGTAKISIEQQQELPHHLLNFLSLDQRLEAGHFVEKAGTLIDGLHSNNRPALLCVGSTMYLSLLLEGIAETGSGDSQFRNEQSALSNEELYAKLIDLDPLRAKELHPNDRLRVIRALEICNSTGKKASQLYKEQKKDLKYSTLFIILCWNREKLAHRIDLRTEQMLQAGLIEEVETLSKKYGPESQIFESIGYAETLKFINAEINEDELKEEIAMHTKQLAKRQMTFLRQFPKKHSFKISPENPFKAIKMGNKGNKIELEGIKLSFNDLVQNCSLFLSHADANQALYVDAESLFNTLS